ncbi:MAG: 50S ribosomal protein L5 [Candidatus Uhrbacteria bacterium]|nr:50S ribosomal protein L5 [Patescibacteria group bacterium]MBU1907475.1 50S ribosomal protein L5 [Patescibacteria group bacterium]
MASILREKYKKEVIPALQEQFGIANVMAVPKIEKVTINVGLGKDLKDSHYQEVVEDTLRRISGQNPVKTKARKSIAGFKIREGMVVGMKVSLRGKRMWDFLDKLVNVTFPRVNDFRGIDPKVIDRGGNFSYGFKEHIAFPEINPDEIDSLHGLEVVISTNADSKEEGLALFKSLGFPFKEVKAKK